MNLDVNGSSACHLYIHERTRSFLFPKSLRFLCSFFLPFVVNTRKGPVMDRQNVCVHPTPKDGGIGK